MIPELELHGVRVQIVLILEIRLVVLAHIMVEQGDGYDQRHVSVPVLTGAADAPLPGKAIGKFRVVEDDVPTD